MKAARSTPCVGLSSGLGSNLGTGGAQPGQEILGGRRGIIGTDDRRDDRNAVGARGQDLIEIRRLNAPDRQDGRFDGGSYGTQGIEPDGLPV